MSVGRTRIAAHWDALQVFEGKVQRMYFAATSPGLAARMMADFYREWNALRGWT